jgi:hypothetical protein
MASPAGDQPAHPVTVDDARTSAIHRDILGSVSNCNPVVLARIKEPDTFHADQRNGADVQTHVRTRGLHLLLEFIEIFASQLTDQLTILTSVLSSLAR